jgi:hypothetical protein
VHQFARFQNNPKKSHENAVKQQIGQYLLGTRNKGIIFKPDQSKMGTLECFVDADFAGNDTKDRSYDPNSVRSRTRCDTVYRMPDHMVQQTAIRNLSVHDRS